MGTPWPSLLPVKDKVLARDGDEEAAGRGPWDKGRAQDQKGWLGLAGLGWAGLAGWLKGR